MKFLCVCVFYIYVRVAYSFYLESSGSSTNPNDSQNEYSTLNLQNTYYSNNPDVRTSQPNNVQNGYNYPSTPESISGQPSTNPPNNWVGPGLPIPYQIPQTSSGIQQTEPVNPPSFTPGQSPHTSVIQHIIKNPYIKEIYTKNLPPKRYTIIHPNGQIEYTDEISGVTSKYSDYVMLKAADILANVRQSNVYDNLPAQMPYTRPNPLSNPITTSNQNGDWTSGNSYQRQYNTEYPNNNLGIPEVPNQNGNYQSYLNPKQQETFTKLNENVNSNPTGITEGLQIPTNTQVTENTPKDGDSSKSVIETSPDNVVAGNPLPIYPETIQIDVPTKHDVPAANTLQVADLTEAEGLSAVATNVTDFINTLEKQILSINESLSGDTTVPIPYEVEQREILPVILPEVKPLSIVPEIQTASQIKNSQTEITPTLATIEEPLTSSNLNDSSIDFIKENEQSADTSTTPTNKTKTIDDEKKTIVNDTAAPSISKESLPELKPATGAPIPWFHLSEDTIWEALRNNTSNIYFLFLPPRPKVTKEIRTTIFPNGTSIKEITETLSDYSQDAKPDLKKKKQ